MEQKKNIWSSEAMSGVYKVAHGLGTGAIE